MAISSGRVKTPLILQMEAVECGAAALAIVLGYYGLYVPLERVREDCGVSRDGSLAINIVQAARRYGMVATGLRKEPEDLEHLTMPLILHWNFSHFVVLEGIVKGRAYINDPASGRYTVTMEELDQSFTGVVLSIRPGEKFRPGGEQTTFRTMLIPKIRPEIIPCIFLFIAGVAMLLPGIAIPIAHQVFMDQIALANRGYLLYPLLIFMAGFVILQVAITWVREICLVRWETDLSFRLSRTFFQKILFLPIRFFDQRYAGEISQRVSLNDHVAMIISGRAATAVLDIIISLVYLTLLLFLSYTLTIVACLIALANYAFLRWVTARQVELSRKLILEQGRLWGVTSSGIQMIESLKSGGSESEFFERWAGHHAGFVNTERSISKNASFMNIVPALINGIGTTAILAVGTNLILAGTISIGFFFAYQALLVNFLQPIQRLINVGGEISELEGSLQRLVDVEKNLPDDTELKIHEATEQEQDPQRKLTGHVEWKDVSFGYNPLQPPILKNISITIPPGGSVALVGPSGCGKSTIARLMAGLYEPWSGEIMIDGILLNEIPGQKRYLSVAYVSQSIFILEGTVRENITLWDKTIRNRRIIQASRDAEIDDLISSLPGGYDAFIEEGGRNLSGGEKQRMEIARALAGDPTVLVLDEATSALDPVTEKKIEANLRKRSCTCLIIAHRLSTIRDCDEIIVLDKGSIVEQGRHEELMEKRGPYYQLIMAEEEKRETGGNT